MRILWRLTAVTVWVQTMRAITRIDYSHSTPPMDTALAPRKSPRQTRSAATVTAILDATARILVERGYAATSTNAVAERAGVSVGSLYQYFPNKDALIAALHARHGAQMKAVIEGALARAMDLDLDTGLADLVDAAVEAHRIDADLHRVLELQLADLDLHDAHDPFEALLQDRIVALLTRHRAVIGVSDLPLAAYMLPAQRAPPDPHHHAGPAARRDAEGRERRDRPHDAGLPDRAGSGMSAPGRPEGEYRGAGHAGTPASPPGRPEGEYRAAEHEGSPASAVQALAATRAWVAGAVVGLNLCPFAKAPLVKGQIRYVACESDDPRAVMTLLCDEMRTLAAADPEVVETTLLVLADALTDFDDYNDFLGAADAALVELGLEGVLQVASFHPDYRYADADPDAIANATNRSPYPLLHLLREASVERAVAAYPEADAIVERNIATLEALGPAGWDALALQWLNPGR